MVMNLMKALARSGGDGGRKGRRKSKKNKNCPEATHTPPLVVVGDDPMNKLQQDDDRAKQKIKKEQQPTSIKTTTTETATTQPSSFSSLGSTYSDITASEDGGVIIHDNRAHKWEMDIAAAKKRLADAIKNDGDVVGRTITFNTANVTNVTKKINFPRRQSSPNSTTAEQQQQNPQTEPPGVVSIKKFDFEGIAAKINRQLGWDPRNDQTNGENRKEQRRGKQTNQETTHAAPMENPRNDRMNGETQKEQQQRRGKQENIKTTSARQLLPVTVAVAPAMEKNNHAVFDYLDNEQGDDIECGKEEIAYPPTEQQQQQQRVTLIKEHATTTKTSKTSMQRGDAEEYDARVLEDNKVAMEMKSFVEGLSSLKSSMIPANQYCTNTNSDINRYGQMIEEENERLRGLIARLEEEIKNDNDAANNGEVKDPAIVSPSTPPRDNLNKHKNNGGSNGGGIPAFISLVPPTEDEYSPPTRKKRNFAARDQFVQAVVESSSAARRRPTEGVASSATRARPMVQENENRENERPGGATKLSMIHRQEKPARSSFAARDEFVRNVRAQSNANGSRIIITNSSEGYDLDGSAIREMDEGQEKHQRQSSNIFRARDEFVLAAAASSVRGSEETGSRGVAPPSRIRPTNGDNDNDDSETEGALMWDEMERHIGWVRRARETQQNRYLSEAAKQKEEFEQERRKWQKEHQDILRRLGDCRKSEEERHRVEMAKLKASMEREREERKHIRNELLERSTKNIRTAEAVKLKLIVNKIEAIENRGMKVAELQAQTYREAKEAGYNPKIIEHIIALKEKDKKALAHEDTLIEFYRDALDI